MIDLNSSRGVDEIANDWLKAVRSFFDTSRRGCSWKLPKDDDKKVKFGSYREKFFFQFKYQLLRDDSINRNQRKQYLVLLKKWRDQFDDIILASPIIMRDEVQKIDNNEEGRADLLKCLNDVFTRIYEHEQISPLLDDLVNQLNVKTCPYCNRLFIYTFKGNNRNERPELDHFYPKSKYPIFCLSFYNLIPACHSCNHVKAEVKIGLNPYERAFKSHFMITDKDGNELQWPQIFRFKGENKKVAFRQPDNDEKQNIEVLGLEDVYNKHMDYVDELIQKSYDYDRYALEALVESFKGAAGYDPQKVFDFVWGKHLAEAKYEDRPLSKLTDDILKMLKIK